MRRLTVIALLVFITIAVTAVGEVQEPLRIRCQWSRPATGSPVVLYQLNIVDANTGLETTHVVPAQAGEIQEFIFTDGEYNHEYKARVRGLDADGDAGPWSDWSPLIDFEVDEPDPDQ